MYGATKPVRCGTSLKIVEKNGRCGILAANLGDFKAQAGIKEGGGHKTVSIPG